MSICDDEVRRIAESECVKTFAGRSVMITGATGMIGKCLCDVFMEYNRSATDKVKVVAVNRSRDNMSARLGEYEDDSNMTMLSFDINKSIEYPDRVDYIIHAAGNTHPMQYSTDPVGTVETNVIGTSNLLRYAISNNINGFCFLSSVEIYGENRRDTDAFDESYLGYIDCNTVRAGYPEGKRAGETLCNAYAAGGNLKFWIPRLSRTYGPTMQYGDSKAIAQFIKNAADREDIVLKSEGKQLYSYCYVTDTVSAILSIMAYGISGTAYNVANPESDITLADLASKLAAIGESKVVYELPDDIERRGYSTATKATLDVSRLLLLGWKPHVDIDNGLKDTVECVMHMSR